MDILITGVCGFIGSHLARKLLEQNHRVYGIDNFLTGQRTNQIHLREFSQFTFFESDISDESLWILLSKKIPHVDRIYHLACPTGVPNCVKLSLEMLLTSSIGTRLMSEFAQLKNASILFTSSSEIYGDPLVFPQTEKYWGNVDPIGLRSPYEEGKRYAESFLFSYAKKYGLNVVIARLFNTYGPEMSIAETRVIPKMLQQALHNKPITVYGNGQQTRTFCYIDDMVGGLMLLMDKGIAGQVYNIGSSKEISMHDLARLIIKLTKTKSKSITKKFAIPDHKRRLPDINKVQKLGWQPTVSLEEGLQKTITYFQNL